MESSELKTLKVEMEQIMPSGIVDASRAVGEHLASAVENHKRTFSVVTTIVDKVVQAKKIVEEELDGLLIKKAELIAENTKIFNDRHESVKVVDTEIQSKQNTVGSLEKTIEGYSVKIDSLNKNIVGLIFEKDNLTNEITNMTAGMQSLRSSSIELQNDANMAKNKRADEEAKLSEVLKQVEDAQKKLQVVNNEIITKKQ